MNARCKAKKKSGERCNAATAKKGMCVLHANPGRAAELGRKSGVARGRVVSSGGSHPELIPPRTAEEVRNALGQILADVRAGRLDPKIASTMAYVASVLLKSIEICEARKPRITGTRRDQPGVPDMLNPAVQCLLRMRVYEPKHIREKYGIIDANADELDAKYLALRAGGDPALPPGPTLAEGSPAVATQDEGAVGSDTQPR